MAVFAPIQSAQEFGLPPEFSDDLFKNIQDQVSRSQRIGTQRASDLAGRFPAMGAGGDVARRGIARSAADAGLQQSQELQLQGVQELMRDRQLQDQRLFQAEQAGADRQMRQFLQDLELRTKGTIAQRERDFMRDEAFKEFIGGLLGTVSGGIGGGIGGGR